MLCWKKEILVGGAQLLPYGLLPVLHQEPPAAGVQAPSEDTGRHLSAHLNRHCTKYNKKHQLNEPLKIYYSMIQSSTIYPMFQSGNIFCAVHVKLPQSVYYLYLSVLVSSSMRGISVQFGLTNWISRHDFCWFTCLRFGYFCICIITLLCDSAFKHMLISIAKWNGAWRVCGFVSSCICCFCIFVSMRLCILVF